MKLRINEAIARANDSGHPVLKKEIAARLFPNVEGGAQQVNMTNLCNGRTKRFTPETVIVICEMCHCTPNYLFGYED